MGPESEHSLSAGELIIVGSGHLAWQLGEALTLAGIHCAGVWARKPSAAAALAVRLQSRVLPGDPGNWPAADYVLLAVTDAAIAECAQWIPARPEQLVFHASGSGNLLPLSRHPACGVFWPLAALRKERSPDWQQTPVFVEGSDPGSAQRLLNLAHRISGVVFEADTPLRNAYHLSAVASANFTLFLLAETQQWLHKQGGDHRLLLPILSQVLADFAEASNLHDRQTGPAARGDGGTVDRQCRAVSEQPALAALYRLFSDLIALQHGSKI